MLPPGHDIYDRIDEYFLDIAHELLFSAPLDDSTLVHYLVPCFVYYYSTRRVVHQLFAGPREPPVRHARH